MCLHSRELNFEISTISPDFHGAVPKANSRRSARFARPIPIRAPKKQHGARMKPMRLSCCQSVQVRTTRMMMPTTALGRFIAVVAIVSATMIPVAMAQKSSPIECLLALSEADHNDDNAVDWNEYQAVLLDLAATSREGCQFTLDFVAVQSMYNEAACSCQQQQKRHHQHTASSRLSVSTSRCHHCSAPSLSRRVFLVHL
jgi:hypothetical protein